MPSTGDIGVIHMPLQRIPPGKSHHTTPNHQSTSEHISPCLYALLVSHVLADALTIDVCLINPNSTAHPLLRLPPTTVGSYVAPEV